MKIERACVLGIVLLAGFVSVGIADVVTDGLYLYTDARTPGPIPTEKWAPVKDGVGNDIGPWGPLYGIGADGAYIPTYQTATRTTNNGTAYVPHYDFSFSSGVGGGVIDFASAFKPDYDEDWTAEIWVYVDATYVGESQPCLWSNQSLSANGMRVNLANWDNNGTTMVAMEARDNTNPDKVTWNNTANNGGAEWATGKWMQVVASYDGTTGQQPVMDLYVNGQLARHYIDTEAVPATANFTAIGRNSIGARGRYDNPDVSVNRNFLDGGISVFRLYEKALSAAEVEQNYNSDASWMIVPEPVSLIFVSLGGALIARRKRSK